MSSLYLQEVVHTLGGLSIEEPRDSPFKSHSFPSEERCISLYRVYDNLSQSQFDDITGFQAGDPDRSSKSPREVFTPERIHEHLDWYNKNPTPFISFWATFDEADCKLKKRLERNWNGLDPHSLTIAEVVIPVGRGRTVWLNDRRDVLKMVDQADELYKGIYKNFANLEWWVWGSVPRDCVKQLFRYQGND